VAEDDELYPFDDEDDEEFFRAWDEAERDAVTVLREALAGSVGAAPPEPEMAAATARLRTGVAEDRWPVRHIASAAGWSGNPPADDRRYCVEAAGAMIAMREESGLEVEQESAIMTLDHADWLGAVIGAVRAGPGAPVDDHNLVGYINSCPEIDGELDPDDVTLIESAFDFVVYTWEAAGVVDENRRLTTLGTWVLPRALAWAWHADFDSTEPG
jgi:hypothetical protein